jgi:hypothetical protein
VHKRLAYRIHAALERRFPERRLFLKSDAETRFIRLGSGTQALGVVVGALTLGWTILATAIIVMDSLGAGDARQQAQRQQSLYEERLSPCRPTATCAPRKLPARRNASTLRWPRSVRCRRAFWPPRKAARSWKPGST